MLKHFNAQDKNSKDMEAFDKSHNITVNMLNS